MKWIVRYYKVADLSYVLHNNSDYNHCWKTLKETSFDERNKVYLCQSEMKVFDFDCIVKTLYPKKQPASYDALIVNEKDKLVYCVEFKNQNAAEIDNSNIQKKLKNGKDILTDLCKKNNVSGKSFFVKNICLKNRIYIDSSIVLYLRKINVDIEMALKIVQYDLI